VTFLNTDDIMELALALARLDTVPADSAIYHPGERVERVLVGIDIRVPELILAKDLGFHLALGHHPAGGSAILGFHHVLRRHVEQMTTAGVPGTTAREAICKVIEERRILNSMENYDHAPSIARLIDMPYMNIHTPLDEIGRSRMAEAVNQLDEAATVADLITLFYDTFGEFRNAATRIETRVGRAKNPIGRVVVSHAAGTNGGYPVAKAYFEHGIDTLIYIHCRPTDSEKLAEEFGEAKNLIVTGHVASDSLGMNPFIDLLRTRGLEVEAISGIVLP
jgi:hypothetical protein